jgi:lipopolysaccharide biosynthesis protein
LKDGDVWRNHLLECLIGGADPVAEAKAAFGNDAAAGVLIPSGSLHDLAERETHFGNITWLDRILSQMDCSRYSGNYEFRFPAGSMFWFRVDALRGLLELEIGADDFAHETGQLDGTLAHALERLVLLLAEQRGYHYLEVDMSHPVACE